MNHFHNILFFHQKVLKKLKGFAIFSFCIGHPNKKLLKKLILCNTVVRVMYLHVNVHVDKQMGYVGQEQLHHLHAHGANVGVSVSHIITFTVLSIGLSHIDTLCFDYISSSVNEIMRSSLIPKLTPCT